MPRFDYIYTNFTSGEFSPLLSGRVDLTKYKGGCEILENFIPRPHGPAVGRGGLRYIAPCKYDDYETRLIPFDAGSGSGLFHIEFGDQYIRFITEDGEGNKRTNAFADVSFSVIPEPAAGLFLLFGSLLLSRGRRSLVKPPGV